MDKRSAILGSAAAVVLVAEIVGHTGRLWICSTATGPQAAIACQHPLGTLSAIGSRVMELVRMMSEPRRLEGPPPVVKPDPYQSGSQNHP